MDNVEPKEDNGFPRLNKVAIQEASEGSQVKNNVNCVSGNDPPIYPGSNFCKKIKSTFKY